MRADLVIAFQLFKDNPEGAVEQVRTLTTTYSARVKDALAGKDDATASGLAPAVESLATVLARGKGHVPKGEPAKSLNALNGVLAAAEQTVVGDVANTTSYKASLMAGLLRQAAVRYEDAVNDKKLDRDAYLDAWALRLQAMGYYTSIEDDLREADLETATDIHDDTEAIESILPYDDPPDPPEPAKDLTDAVARVSSALERVAAAVLLKDVGEPSATP
jgi:hypothetical protein